MKQLSSLFVSLLLITNLASCGGGGGSGGGGATTPPPPTNVATAQPAAKTINVGDTVSFTVATSGTAKITYQWRKDTVNITGGNRKNLIY